MSVGYYIRAGAPSQGCTCSIKGHGGEAVLVCVDLQCSVKAPAPKRVMPQSIGFYSRFTCFGSS